MGVASGTISPRFHKVDEVAGSDGVKVAGAGEALGKLSAEAARARGLWNLRCADTSGGLLGRTLLTLVSSKVGSRRAPPAMMILGGGDTG